MVLTGFLRCRLLAGSAVRRSSDSHALLHLRCHRHAGLYPNCGSFFFPWCHAQLWALLTWILPEQMFCFICLRCLERWPWWTAHISTETTTSRPSLRLCCFSSGVFRMRPLHGLCICVCVFLTYTVSHMSVWNHQMCHWRGVAGDHVGLHARQTVRPRVRLQPRGGDDVWQWICHHLFYLFLHALRLPGTHNFLGFFFFFNLPCS